MSESPAPAPWADRLKTWNPFFPASALLVLAGAAMVLGPGRFLEPGQAFLLLGVIEGYQLLVLGAAVLLARRSGYRPDVRFLLCTAAVFLLDAPLFHATFGGIDPGLGLVMGAAAWAFGVLKVWAVSRLTVRGPAFFGLPRATLATGGLFLLLIDIGPSALSLLRDSHETAWGSPGWLTLAPAVCFAPALLFSDWKRRAALPGLAQLGCLAAAPGAALLHFASWGFVFPGDATGSAVGAALGALQPALVAFPLGVLAIALARGSRALSDGWLVGAPGLCLLGGLFLSGDWATTDWIDPSPFRTAALSAVLFLAAARTRFGRPGLFPAALLASLAFLGSGPEALLKLAFRPDLSAVIGLHFPLAWLVAERRTPLAAVMASAASAASWAWLFAGAEGVDVWFLGPQVFAGLSVALLLLLRARRAWLLAPGAASLGAAAFQSFLRPGPAPELFAAALGGAVLAGGLLARRREFAALGALGLAAESVNRLRFWVPSTVEGVGACLVGGGFLLLAAGVGWSVWPTPEAPPEPSSPPGSAPARRPRAIGTGLALSPAGIAWIVVLGLGSLWVVLSSGGRWEDRSYHMENYARMNVAGILNLEEKFRESARIDADEDGRGEYGFLADLERAELIRFDRDLDSRGAGARGGVLYTVLLPDGAGRWIAGAESPAPPGRSAAAAREASIAVFAWPEAPGCSGRSLLLAVGNRLYRRSGLRRSFRLPAEPWSLAPVRCDGKSRIVLDEELAAAGGWTEAGSVEGGTGRS
ncbi:MAG: hypothetical protein MUC63_00610 [Planctomycetes bacterium]|jgi:hypothetical protein|nr:hypothetical protein [Planctomycetota bacterium]